MRTVLLVPLRVPSPPRRNIARIREPQPPPGDCSGATEEPNPWPIEHNPDDPNRSPDDPYRSNPTDEDIRRQSRLDNELPMDPELAEVSANGGKDYDVRDRHRHRCSAQLSTA